MSIEAPQTSYPAASSPRPAGSLPSNSLATTQTLEAFAALPKVQCPPVLASIICESVTQTKCVQNRDSNDSGLVTTFLPSAVSALLVVVGWIVVNKAQSNRERRKQIREYVSNLCVNLGALEVMAIGYHTAIREEAKEQEIISKLGRLEKGCSTLPRFITSQKYLFKAVEAKKLKMDGRCLQVLRKAITLNHFGDEHTAALGRQDDFILNLELASNEMREALDCVLIDALD